ncbi:hypothetical protein TNCV_2424381 [Trichonephila clavipes]|nr:hypothetical protein TNCV_2424381 [Trichonephila clavipes]
MHVKSVVAVSPSFDVAKWINNGKTRSRHQAVGHPLVIKEKGRQKLSRLVKAKLASDSGSADKPNTMRVQVHVLRYIQFSGHYWIWDCAADVQLLWVCVDQASLPTSVFPTRKGIFQQNSVPCQKTRIVLEGFDKHKDGFSLINNLATYHDGS